MQVENVTRVYSGKIGCMCGCNGKYRTASKFRELVGKERGYAVDDNEVSDRSVKIMYTKVMSNPNRVEEGNYVYVEHNGRIQVVYFPE